MTAALYNQDGQWGIPAFVWPAVLGVSVAVHLALLIYGLAPDAAPPEDTSEDVQTEVVIESGGSAFQSVTSVESLQPETTAPDIARPAEAGDVPSVPEAVAPSAPQSTAVPANEVSGEKLQSVDAQAVAPLNAPTDVASVAEPPSSGAASANPVVPAQVQNAIQPEPSTVAVTSVSPVAVVSETSASIQAPSAISSPTTSPAAVPLEAIAPIEVTTEADVEAVVQAIEPGPVSAPVTLSTNSSRPTVSGIQALAAAPVQGVEVIRPAPVAETPDTDAPASGATATRPSSPSVSSLRPGRAQPAAPVGPAQSNSAPAVQPGAVAGPPVQAARPSVQAVKPAQQQIAAVSPTQSGAEVIRPSEPDTSNIPASLPASDQAEGVPPVDVASIDPLAQVSSYIAGYDAGGCTHLSVTSAGVETANVTAYGVAIDSFLRFDQKFRTDQGYEAKIEVRLITEKQCALIENLGLSEGIEAPDLVTLDKTVVRSGTALSGIIQRDLPQNRIAAASASGVPLNGRGPPELYIIDDEGRIHDGRSHILPASNAVTAGGWRFAVPVTLVSRVKEETALVLAIWNRPPENQPKRFSVLAADAISRVLAEPGVYSLSAFKVSR